MPITWSSLQQFCRKRVIEPKVRRQIAKWLPYKQMLAHEALAWVYQKLCRKIETGDALAFGPPRKTYRDGFLITYQLRPGEVAFLDITHAPVSGGDDEPGSSNGPTSFSPGNGSGSAHPGGGDTKATLARLLAGTADAAVQHPYVTQPVMFGYWYDPFRFPSKDFDMFVAPSSSRQFLPSLIVVDADLFGIEPFLFALEGGFRGYDRNGSRYLVRPYLFYSYGSLSDTFWHLEVLAYRRAMFGWHMHSIEAYLDRSYMERYVLCAGIGGIHAALSRAVASLRHPLFAPLGTMTGAAYVIAAAQRLAADREVGGWQLGLYPEPGFARAIADGRAGRRFFLGRLRHRHWIATALMPFWREALRFHALNRMIRGLAGLVPASDRAVRTGQVRQEACLLPIGWADTDARTHDGKVGGGGDPIAGERGRCRDATGYASVPAEPWWDAVMGDAAPETAASTSAWASDWRAWMDGAGRIGGMLDDRAVRTERLELV